MKNFYPNKWNKDSDPSNWWMMENIDGINVYWDGEGTLFTRNWRKIDSPKWFLETLPNFVIEGKLW
jgi:DNA ligase-1